MSVKRRNIDRKTLFLSCWKQELCFMRKSDKKIENQIRDVLTDVCEDTLKSYDGFLWVTLIRSISLHSRKV